MFQAPAFIVGAVVVLLSFADHSMTGGSSVTIDECNAEAKRRQCEAMKARKRCLERVKEKRCEEEERQKRCEKKQGEEERQKRCQEAQKKVRCEIERQIKGLPSDLDFDLDSDKHIPWYRRFSI
jgi:membrane protein involved in colicin uptake